MKTEYVRDWMTPDPVTVGPDTSVSLAYDPMQKHHIRRLLVTLDTPIKVACELTLKHKIGGLPAEIEGRLVGILVGSDIFRLVAQRQFENKRERRHHAH